MSFTYPRRRNNPPIKRTGSSGFPGGWNSLPNQASLKDTELSELINGVYSQYGTISKRQGTQIQGTGLGGNSIIQGGVFYDIGGTDYTLAITDEGKVYKYNYSTQLWSLLTGTNPVGYSDTDPEFVDNSPVFATTDYINMVQVNGKIYFANPTDRVVIFDGSAWSVYVELADPATKPQITKTGAGTGTRTYYYRYVDANEFGTTLASPANDGGQSNGDGFYEDMPEIDADTYLTVTLPAAATGATKRWIFRGDTAENEFFLKEIDAADTVFIDKNTPDVQPNYLYATPEANTTPGYHFYLLTSFANSLVGTTVEEGKDVLVWSAGDDKVDSFALADGAGFDGYQKGDGQSINAIKSFSIANKDGLAIFKDARVGILEFDSEGGGNIQNVNVIRGTMSPMSPHVAGNNLRFYSQEGVSSIGHEQNFGSILRYSVLSLKANSVTERVTPANLPQVCSEYYKNLSLFGISTGGVGDGNDSVLVFDERYNTWSHWTGLTPKVFFKGIHPTTKVEDIYFGDNSASRVLKMFTGKTDYATSSGSGNAITLSISTKQYDANLPDRFKKFDKVVMVFGSLFGNGTTAQAYYMDENGQGSLPRYRISTDPVLSGFGNDEWGTQEIGMMTQDEQGETLNLRYIDLQQKDLFWTKINIQNDGTSDEISLLGIFFYYSDSERQLPAKSRLSVLA